MVKKRLISVLISLLLVIGIIPAVEFSASAMDILKSYSAVINGKTVTKNSYPGQNNCWKYANGIYKIIWGCYFTSDFVGAAATDYNMLKELSADNRKITADTAQRYISAAPLGAVIRVCRTSSTAYSDGSDGHSLILAGKGNGGFYFFEDWGAGSSGYDNVATFYTYSEISNYFNNSKKYHYFKYIKWPKATVFSPDYYITYNANGGTGAPSKTGKEKNIDVTLSSNIPSRSGYAFTGWATSATATEAQYFAEGTFKTNKNTTLYAVWKKAKNFGKSFSAKIANTEMSRFLTTESDGNVASYSVKNNTSQIWQFTRCSDGSYKIKNKKNGYYLSITYAVVGAGGNVKSFYISDSPAQNWFFVPTGGKYLLYSKCTDKPLCINNSGTSNGTNIGTDYLTGEKNQLFSVYKDIKAPVISNVKFSDITSNSFKVSGKITDNKKIKSAKIYSFTTEGGNDDVTSDKLTLDGGDFSYTVNREDHSFDYGAYTVKFVVTDNALNKTTHICYTEIKQNYMPAKTVKFQNHYYGIYNVALSYTKAKAFAQSAGGHLVNIESGAEQAEIFKFIKNHGSKSFYWLGAEDADGDNSFKWGNNGAEVRITNWAKGEPDSTTQPYVYMSRHDIGSINAGEWCDSDNVSSLDKSSAYYLGKFGFVIEFDSIPVPVLKSAKLTSKGLSVTYSRVPIASGYELYRRLSTEKVYKKIAVVSGVNTLKYVDADLKSGQTAFYGVKALVDTDSSAIQSTPVKATYLNSPVIKSIKKSGITAKIKWSKVAGADGYKLYRKTGNGKYKLIATLKSGKKTSFSNKNLKKGKKYTYRIRAYKKVSKAVKFSLYSKSKSKKI